MKLTYFLDPFGCVKNQVDAENMMAFLDRAGWAPAENVENAALIIVNSCAFIQSAKQESINAVLGWRKLYPEKKILLAGCLAQRYAQELTAALPEADALFGVDDLGRITEAARKAVTGEASGTEMKQRRKRAPAAGKRPLLSPPGSAYVKISEGCDNRCSFCAIPLIRGSLRSRGIADIIEECKTLLKRGIKELCLIGQDTGSYGHGLSGEEPPDLPALLEALSRLSGKFRVRLLYIHPDNFPLAILDIMEKDPRFIPYFDIPFQHGSEKILKAMNRRGSAETYLALIETIRRRLPDAVIRSTFLTGFPGETEDDFALLLDFQKKARLDWLGCFVYSREENTPAWSMKGRVPKKISGERKRLVEEAQIPLTERQIERFVGRAFDVLVEERFEAPASGSPSPGAPGDGVIYLGRFPFQAPEVDGLAVITNASAEDAPTPGELLTCRVTGRAGFDLRAEPSGS